MAQTSIHICPVKGGSELHNERRKVLDYVRKELTPQNLSIKMPYYPCIIDQKAKIADDYQTSHGKKMHAKATPIREAVVVIQENTTMEQLYTACVKCRDRFGIDAMQIHMHKDEGHTAEDGSWKPNLHAHIVFNWYNFKTHSTCKLSPQNMAEMQTIFAECLQMERGVSSDRKHLNAIQQKNEAEAAKLQRLQEQIQEQREQHKADLQQECKDLRKSGAYTVKAFDYLCEFDAVKPTTEQQKYRDNLEQECRRELPTETTALSQHALKLRYNLMNTINSVMDIGKKLRKLASNIPLLKRRRLAHEAELEQEVINAREEAKEAQETLKNEAAIFDQRELNLREREINADKREQTEKTERKELEAKIEELNKTQSNWLEDFRTIGKKLTSLGDKSVAFLEEMGIRDAVGPGIWDEAKKQNQQHQTQSYNAYHDIKHH